MVNTGSIAATAVARASAFIVAGASCQRNRSKSAFPSEESRAYSTRLLRMPAARASATYCFSKASSPHCAAAEIFRSGVASGGRVSWRFFNHPSTPDRVLPAQRGYLVPSLGWTVVKSVPERRLYCEGDPMITGPDGLAGELTNPEVLV